MKRLGMSITFFIIGLFTTWAAMVAGSHMPLRFPFKWTYQGYSGCYEIGSCSVPWWVSALFIAYLLGPSLIFAMMGWVSAPPSISISKKLTRLLTLIAITSLLYVAGYAISR